MLKDTLAKMKTLTMKTGDWIDQLFSDDLQSWRTYLFTQMEYITVSPMEYSYLWNRINEGDKSDLIEITQKLKELVPPIDPARIFNDRMENQ